MASVLDQPQRSAAAREASRSNGAKSRGPRTRSGKAVSAKNALKHGLRARQSVRPAELLAWIKAIEANLVASLGVIGQDRREQLDRLLSILLLIDRTDRLITAELAKLQEMVVASVAEKDGGMVGGPTDSEDLGPLRKLIAYRKRFRAQRDQCLKRIVRRVAV